MVRLQFDDVCNSDCWVTGGAGSGTSRGRPRHSMSISGSQLNNELSATASRSQRHSLSDTRLDGDDAAVPATSGRRSGFLEPLSRSSSTAVTGSGLPSCTTSETFC